ncbi:uncharacterized protein LOC108257803 isoform X3 [Ictalurus punctatus]|uniref:Uncharacterized protein LOC108257803 isoform X3 n=1 Tax=Ictalurus punctatus TaxID=7998 RepID=A0A2D0PZ96_ICTPU|nr:uncharacterized protein LOC108257803 isoform X3 [Ictalurus punctatus]
MDEEVHLLWGRWCLHEHESWWRSDCPSAERGRERMLNNTMCARVCMHELSAGMDKTRTLLLLTKASTQFQHTEHLAVASTTAEVQGRAKVEITLKGNLKGFTDLTNPQLKQHMDAAINIGVEDLKARFSGLLKDEGAQTPVKSFRVLNLDTWRKGQASLLTFGNDDVADLLRHFKEPLERSGCNMAAIQDEWQGLKILVSHNFKDKSHSGLWETMLTKDAYRQDYKWSWCRLCW